MQMIIMAHIRTYSLYLNPYNQGALAYGTILPRQAKSFKILQL